MLLPYLRTFCITHFFCAFVFFSHLFFFSLYSYEIHDCHSIEEVLDEIHDENYPITFDEQKRTSTLLIFDVDNTIFRAAQMIGTDEWFRDSIKAAYEKNPKNRFLAKQRVIELWHAIQCITPIVPIEEEKTAATIKTAQDKVTVIALTTRSHQISATTILQLASLGIDFSFSSPKYDHLWVPNAREALFVHGVLFTSAYNKGIALEELLKTLDYHPKKIVFLNDKLDHIEELIHIEKTTGASLVGLRYAKADSFQSQFSRTDAEKEFEQFSTIFQAASLEKPSS